MMRFVEIVVDNFSNVLEFCMKKISIMEVHDQLHSVIIELNNIQSVLMGF